MVHAVAMPNSLAALRHFFKIEYLQKVILCFYSHLYIFHVQLLSKTLVSRQLFYCYTYECAVSESFL